MVGERIESVPLRTLDDRPDAFNDMAWHCFRQRESIEAKAEVDTLASSLEKMDV